MLSCISDKSSGFGAKLGRFLSGAVVAVLAMASTAYAGGPPTLAVTSITESNYTTNATATLTLTFTTPETNTIVNGDWVLGLNLSGFTVANCTGASITDNGTTLANASCGTIGSGLVYFVATGAGAVVTSGHTIVVTLQVTNGSSAGVAGFATTSTFDTSPASPGTTTYFPAIGSGNNGFTIVAPSPVSVPTIGTWELMLAALLLALTARIAIRRRN